MSKNNITVKCPSKTKMREAGYYGEAVVSNEVFSQLNCAFFIGGSDEKTKYLCANPAETKHLNELGIETANIVCDWFKIILATDGRAE